MLHVPRQHRVAAPAHGHIERRPGRRLSVSIAAKPTCSMNRSASSAVSTRSACRGAVLVAVLFDLRRQLDRCHGVRAQRKRAAVFDHRPDCCS